MTDELQALCFLAGANSIFIGDVLLTTKNPQRDRDANLLARLGVKSILLESGSAGAPYAKKVRCNNEDHIDERQNRWGLSDRSRFAL
ncbi:hypothetical protein GCM10007857_83790 [Bradyrhizobium iriomotense]|uniref:Biotin and thiamin synthesis-associated domain-containing protein n=1 Tax=Bradyrhizobium iriomotense TaxID=441950 RepID=A0ABQ6BCT0_9BRAD|nr:hypothetical protein GCM10007857_83790 [Bradyrhizobium iriomotense]